MTALLLVALLIIVGCQIIVIVKWRELVQLAMRFIQDRDYK